MPYLLTLDSGAVEVARCEPENLDRVIASWREAYPNKTLASVTEVDEASIPGRTFRNAWRHCHQNGFRHCMATARDIQRDLLRSRRAKRFIETDVAIARGLAENKDMTAIAQMAQRLRDVTKHPAIEEAQTVEDLAKVWPSVLDEPVPALGGPRIAGDASYDTKALEEWAKGLTDKVVEQTQQIAALQEKLRGAANETHIQTIAQAVHDLVGDTRALQERVKKAEDDAAYALKHGLDHDSARLTEDKMQ